MKSARDCSGGEAVRRTETRENGFAILVTSLPMVNSRKPDGEAGAPGKIKK